MILDFHSGLGLVPTAGKRWSAEDFLVCADRCGTDLAVVESLDNLIHRDDVADESLLAACRAHPRRLLPAATVDLTADEFGPRVAASARRRGFAAVVLRGRLFAASRCLPRVLEELRRAPLPIYRPDCGHAEWDLLHQVAVDWPDLTFVLAPGSFDGLELAHRLVERPNVCFAMPRSLYATGQLEKAVRLMGASRILYAGDFPFQHPARPLGVIFDADLSEPERERVLGGAAVALLKRHGLDVPEPERSTRRQRPPCSIVDVHGHLGADRTRVDYDHRTETMLGYLDRGGAEVLHVSSVEGVYGDVAWGNSFIAREVGRFPNRLRGYAVVNPWEGPPCLDEIRRCHAMGFVGLKPYPPSLWHDLADPIMDPVWELTDALGWPALCHPRPGNVQDLRRTLEKRPSARLMLAHMTSGHREKAALAREFPNAIFEISGAGSSLESIPESLTIAGPENLVFGSDLCTHPVGFTLYPLLCSGLGEDVLRAILRDNALRYFGLQG